ncbi:MAG: TonB-dependent receptor, partial [Gammaproteobacteria bacterium]
MSSFRFRAPVLAAGALAGTLAFSALAEHEEIVVWGEPLSPFSADPGLAPLAETNTALLLKRVAGANVNFNGTLAGIAQYRGMYAERVNIDVDGMTIGNACSNNMDAPLHYLPRTFVERLEVIRGIAPVSSGLETIGGTVIARSRSAEFGSAADFEIGGRVAAGGQSVDGGYSASGEVNLVNRQHRLRAAASREHGNNRDFGDGTIRPTRYERNAFDLGYALRLGSDVLRVDYRRNDTGETGTPALPMDDIYSDADLVRAGWNGHRGALDLSVELYWNGVEHLMSNYRMRRAPPGRRRDNEAAADTLGWRTRAAMPLAGGELRVGADGHLLDYDSLITSPDSATFFARNFDDVERDRYGLYAEWEHLALGRFSVELGLRWTHVAMDAGAVDASMAMMMPPLAMLRDSFNGAERAVDDDNIDAALVVGYALADNLTLEAGVARKNRSQTHQERYLWLPLEA